MCCILKLLGAARASVRAAALGAMPMRRDTVQLQLARCKLHDWEPEMGRGIVIHLTVCAVVDAKEVLCKAEQRAAWLGRITGQESVRLHMKVQPPSSLGNGIHACFNLISVKKSSPRRIWDATVYHAKPVQVRNNSGCPATPIALPPHANVLHKSPMR
jgi:hypothetical protein